MFRMDINGLRFIAVMSVVLFHFSVNGFAGGYAGVDVFFVISGYLMNEISIKVKNNENWFVDFYKKRFNRIYPALIFSIAFATVISLISATPSELLAIKNQVLSALSFTSNLYYLKNTSSYFSGVADSYLLLHTWSLAVEFQFYLLFPVAFWFAHKYKKINITYLTLVAISFALCVFIVRYHQKHAFYLLPFRAWELFLGAYVSNLSPCKINVKAKRYIETLLVLMLVLFSVLVKTNDSWPGFYTLVPVVATAIYLYLSVDNDNTILRFRPIQYIGSASYSIYLYHWPVVYFIYQNQIPYTISTQLIAVVSSLALGMLSYHFIERRFKSVGWGMISFAMLIAALILVFSYVGISKHYLSKEVLVLDGYSGYGESAKGVKQFGNDDGRCFLTSATDDFKYFTKDKCLARNGKKKNLLLIGDSHAAEFSQAFVESFVDYNVMQVTASGCVPLIKTSGPSRCVDLMRFFYNSILPVTNFDVIFVSANWFVFSKDADEQNFLQTDKVLKGKTGNVFYIGQSRAFDMPFYKLAQKNTSEKIMALSNKDALLYNERLLSGLSSSINYIDVYDVGCSAGVCDFFMNGKPMMFDENHFTYEWTVYLTKNKLMPLIK